MNQINRSIRTLFAWALATSIGFPLGILGIVFGAVYFWTPLLVAGIVLTVVGFYGMPLLWVKFGQRRGDRALWRLIEEEGLYTVEMLCMQTGYAPGEVRERLKRMITGRELTGYLLNGDVLEPLDPEKRRADPAARTKKCPNCGALMASDGKQFFCEYCRHREADV